MGTQLRALKPLKITDNIVPKGLQGALNKAPILPRKVSLSGESIKEFGLKIKTDESIHITVSNSQKKSYITLYGLFKHKPHYIHCVLHCILKHELYVSLGALSINYMYLTHIALSIATI